jgi:hypothetical protein
LSWPSLLLYVVVDVVVVVVLYSVVDAFSRSHRARNNGLTKVNVVGSLFWTYSESRGFHNFGHIYEMVGSRISIFAILVLIPLVSNCRFIAKSRIALFCASYSDHSKCSKFLLRSTYENFHDVARR